MRPRKVAVNTFWGLAQARLIKTVARRSFHSTAAEMTHDLHTLRLSNDFLITFGRRRAADKTSALEFVFTLILGAINGHSREEMLFSCPAYTELDLFVFRLGLPVL